MRLGIHWQLGFNAVTEVAAASEGPGCFATARMLRPACGENGPPAQPWFRGEDCRLTCDFISLWASLEAARSWIRSTVRRLRRLGPMPPLSSPQ